MDDLADDVLRAFNSEANPATKIECARTLGALKHRPALETLRTCIEQRRDTPDVLQWVSWAFGEISTTQEEEFLSKELRRVDSEETRRALGGALRKTRLESVRAPKSQMLRKLNPPPTRNPRIREILVRLADLDASSFEGLQASVKLRKEMQQIDPDYLRRYVEWRRLLPVFEQAIGNKKYVYDDQEVDRAG